MTTVQLSDFERKLLHRITQSMVDRVRVPLSDIVFRDELANGEPVKMARDQLEVILLAILEKLK